jgi:hypothetical protein
MRVQRPMPNGKIYAPGGPSSGLRESFGGGGGGEKKKIEAAMGGGARPFLRVHETKKTGARSARGRTRGQNPLV